MLFPFQDIRITDIPDPVTRMGQITWQVARFDQVHPVVSGNKLFKLHEFLVRARETGKKQITTFGGAFSNHLVATAYACHMAGLRSKGFVRGEEPAMYSHTLRHCREYGMELEFLSRERYRQVSGSIHPGEKTQADHEELFVPEGGFHPDGARGASLMMEYLRIIPATHIVLAVGTATTLAGILCGSSATQKVIAIPVLKNMSDVPDRLNYLEVPAEKKPVIVDHVHFGGYAKHTPELLDYMNNLYRDYGLPTDFVYTGKMMYATRELILKRHIPDGSHILCIHTGGLQGNESLTKGSLIF